MGRTSNTRLPSLPHLLSSHLRSRSVSSPSGMEDGEDEILDMEEEDEYDKLPSIRILTKSQFEKLTKSQKKAYMDELDYRETLYLKKQWKDERERRKNNIISEDGTSTNIENSENQDTAPEPVLLPDMAVPPSFDSDCPLHRYRCLVISDQWLTRPVLDPHGWDHDVGFDGINLETSLDIKKNLHASIVGQMSKDKQDFSIQSECAAAYVGPAGSISCAGFDVQTSGRDLVCTVHGDTKVRNLKYCETGCGVSVTSFGKKYFLGTKLEETVTIGRRVKLVLNAGRMGGLGQVAYGGTIEATLRGRDYPVRSDRVTLTSTVLCFDKETVFGGGFQSEFRPLRGTKMSVSVNLNSRKMGQVCIKTSSSEHVEIALIAIVSMVRALLRKRVTDNLSALEGEK